MLLLSRCGSALLMKKINSFLFLFTPLLWGVDIEFTNIKYQSISSHHSSYQLISKSYVQKSETKNYKLFIFNRRQYMLKNNYYLDGFLKTKVAKIHYKKAYLLGGKVYLIETDGYINNVKIVAKEIIYDKKRDYLLKKCVVKTEHSVLRRKKYLIQEG